MRREQRDDHFRRDVREPRRIVEHARPSGIEALGLSRTVTFVCHLAFFALATCGSVRRERADSWAAWISGVNSLDLARRKLEVARAGVRLDVVERIRLRNDERERIA